MLNDINQLLITLTFPYINLFLIGLMYNQPSYFTKNKLEQFHGYNSTVFHYRQFCYPY